MVAVAVNPHLYLRILLDEVMLIREIGVIENSVVMRRRPIFAEIGWGVMGDDDAWGSTLLVVGEGMAQPQNRSFILRIGVMWAPVTHPRRSIARRIFIVIIPTFWWGGARADAFKIIHAAADLQHS